MRRALSNIRSSILSQGAGDELLIRRMLSTIVLVYLTMYGGAGTPSELCL
jgi:hypothetical protein